MLPKRLDATYPDLLRGIADGMPLPTPAYEALHQCANHIQKMLGAMEALQPDLGDDEVSVTIRCTIPSADDIVSVGAASVNVASGKNVDPGNVLILLAAQSVLNTCMDDVHGTSRGFVGENDDTAKPEASN